MRISSATGLLTLSCSHAAYFFWAINKINMKTLLTFTVIIYFFPVFGYLSNPYRLGAENLNMVGELVTDREKSNTFYLGHYWSLLGLQSDGEYEGVPYFLGRLLSSLTFRHSLMIVTLLQVFSK